MMPNVRGLTEKQFSSEMLLNRLCLTVFAIDWTGLTVAANNIELKGIAGL